MCLTRPQLPAGLGELRITNLAVGDATVDLILVRQGPVVAVEPVRRRGEVQVEVTR